MQYFKAYLMIAQVDEGDRQTLPPDLRVMAIRMPHPPGNPEACIIFFGVTDESALCRIVEALWLDRRFVELPNRQRKLFLLGDAVHLQIDESAVTQVGESGPIRGAVEGFRGQLGEMLARLEERDPIPVETPLGVRECRYLEVELPDPAPPRG